MVKRIEKVIQQLDKNTNELDSVKKINITINSENFDKVAGTKAKDMQIEMEKYLHEHNLI